MINIRTLGLLVVASLASFTAQAQRLSLSQLQAQLDQLADQVTELQQLKQSNLAGFSCPIGSALTGFDSNGNPLCTAPWGDNAGTPVFPFDIDCTNNYQQVQAESAITDNLIGLATTLQQSWPDSFTNGGVTATVDIFDIQINGSIVVSAPLLEQDADTPCADAIAVQVGIDEIRVEGSVAAELTGLTNFASDFTFVIQGYQASYQVDLSTPDLSLVVLPANYPKQPQQITQTAKQSDNRELTLLNPDALPSDTISVTQTLLANIFASEFNQVSAPVIGASVFDTLILLPDPVTVSLSEQ